MNVKSAKVLDLRVPTSDTLLGSDPFHLQPDYSSAVLQLETDAGLTGVSVVFTVGAGTDWLCYGIRDLVQLVVGMPIEEFARSPGELYRRLIDHHQLRWLHDGVFRMCCGSILNAMWDLWAKSAGKPIWKLLVDLDPEFVVDCIDWRNLRDALTPEEALALLRQTAPRKSAREAAMVTQGPKAYCTAGWLGLSDTQILDTVRRLRDQGFDAFKLKVGQDLESDVARIGLMRDLIGPECALMVDANQFWGVDEAIGHIQHYHPFNLKWIEEPIARDDVMGYAELASYFQDATFKFACGEHAASPVIFKQLLKSQAIGFCQVDAVRVAGVNDLMAIILLAAKFDIPVCPHGGGIALCNMIQQLSLWDQIAVSGQSETQLVEYIDFLQDSMVRPVEVRDGHYVPPQHPGWGLEFQEDFLADHTFPSGKVWRDRPEEKIGTRFEC